MGNPSRNQQQNNKNTLLKLNAIEGSYTTFDNSSLFVIIELGKEYPILRRYHTERFNDEISINKVGGEFNNCPWNND